MTLEDLLALCAKSRPDAWKVIPCGPGAGPSYLEAWRAGPDGEPLLDGAHTLRAAYRPDVSIGIAWGLVAQGEIDEPWVEAFANEASSHFVDFLYHGSLVERGRYASVDGGRCNLPIPQRDFADSRLSGLWITRWQYGFFDLLNALQGATDFDRYVSRAGFEVR